MNAHRSRGKNRNIENPVVGFMEIISNIEVSRNGRAFFLNEALDSAVADATSATEQYGKESTVTITISVKKLEEGKAVIAAKVNEKLAKGATTGISIYRNKKGELFLEDPYQPNLPNFEGEELSN